MFNENWEWLWVASWEDKHTGNMSWNGPKRHFALETIEFNPQDGRKLWLKGRNRYITK